MENSLKKRYILLRSIVTVFLALCIFNLIAGLTFTGLSLSVPSEVYEAAEITKPSDITKTVIQYYPESVQPVVKTASNIILYASPFPHADFSISNPPLHSKAALQIALWTNLSVVCLFGIIWFLLRKLLYSMSLKEPPFTPEHRKSLHYIAIIIIILALIPHTLESIIYTVYCRNYLGFSIIDSLSAIVLLILGINLYARTKNIVRAESRRRK